MGDVFLVKAEDLLPTSKAIVKVQCDACGAISTTTYQSYLESLRLHEDGYYCRTCVQHLSITKKRIKDAIKAKYGVDSLMQVDDIREKIKATTKKHFGVEYPQQSKVINTRTKETFINRYGFIGFQDKDRLLKAQITLANNGIVPTSSQQLEVYKMLEQLYPDAEECILNKPLVNLNLDIGLKVNGVYIDVETDCEYWHQDKQKDRRRDEAVKKDGYKVLRIRFNKQVPTASQLKDAVDRLLYTDHTFYRIELDTKENKNKQQKI